MAVVRRIIRWGFIAPAVEVRSNFYGSCDVNSALRDGSASIEWERAGVSGMRDAHDVPHNRPGSSGAETFVGGCGTVRGLRCRRLGECQFHERPRITLQLLCGCGVDIIAVARRLVRGG